MYIECNPYGCSVGPIYIMVDKITDWYYIDYNGRSGTCIRMVDSKEINVEEYPETIAKKLREAHIHKE